MKGADVELVRKEAEGIVLEGYAWNAFSIHTADVARGNLQGTEFRVQPWNEYIPNGTGCLLAAFQQNGCMILSEQPVPPDLPDHWAIKPAELADDWTHDDGAWTLVLEAIMDSVPFSQGSDPRRVIFGGDEVSLVRIHANKTCARIFLWLCCEGWGRFGPFGWLKFDDDKFADETGNVIAVKRRDGWQTPGRFASCSWQTPLISDNSKHPHPDHG